jgi:uroporphyrinogen-III decarboxylase
MHFAARHIGKTYGEFASDYRVLAEANLRCLKYFHTDMAWLISDPYRETAAFGAGIEFVAEGVPKCLNHVVETLHDVRKLEITDVNFAERTSDRIKAARLLSAKLQGKKSLIGWLEGQLVEEIEQEFKNLIKKMKGIPFILSAGCEIPVNTPPENLLAMHLARLNNDQKQYFPE